MRLWGRRLACLGLFLFLGCLSKTAFSEGHIQSVNSVGIGRYCGIPYIRLSGIFAGRTGDSADSDYRVPYVIRTPLNARQGNGVTLYEYPHFVTADFGRLVLGYDLLFCRGFSHASVGYGNRPDDGNNILDPTVPDTMVQGGQGRDVNIMADFAQALSRKNEGVRLMGNNSSRRYLTGFSDSSVPLATLVTSGRAEGLFEFAIPFTTDGFNDDFTRNVKEALADHSFTGKVIIVNDEVDEFFGDGEALHDDDPQIRDRYRYYFTPGASHIPETFNCDSAGLTQLPIDHMTPATFIPELKARFLEGHLWATKKSARFAPPKSTQPADQPTDEKGNSLSVDIDGDPQPRLPFVELGEATFRNFNEILEEPFSFLIGSIVDVESVTSLGYRNFGEYISSFIQASEAYRRSGAILLEDELFFVARALRFPPNTMTQNYADRYESFVGPHRPDCAQIP